MAPFLVWMAIFFTTFWKHLGNLWSTWMRKNFLQVQSGHCKRLCNVISSLEKCLKDIEASSKTKVLNKNQCVHLFRKVIHVLKEIMKIVSSDTLDLKFQFILEELCRLQRRVEIVGKECTMQAQWCDAAISQFQNKETFRELLLDLKCCYDATQDLYSLFRSTQTINIQPIEFDAATYEQVLEDEYELEKRLEHVLLEEALQDYELAQHLLLRIRNLDRIDGGDLDTFEVPKNFKRPKLIEKIGKGSYGSVYKSNWCGLTCASKVLEGNLEYLMQCRKEAGILAGLSHPNLVQFLGCGITKKLDENDEEVDMSEMHLVMELMETSLASILKEAKRPLPYHLAIDIMHQIAKGVHYLHDMQIAHLDLKPENVLSSSIYVEDLDPCCVFKVTDYGTSQLEVCSNPKDPKPSMDTIGTHGYMSPEVIKGSKTPLYPFRADVWSFAMICSEILSRKVPYSNLTRRDFYDQIVSTGGTSNKNLRPDLPNNCKELTNLIEECWSQDPLQRPTFSNICERLASLKKSFLKGTYVHEMLPQFGSSRAFKYLRPTFGIRTNEVCDVPMVDEPIPTPKEIQVDLDRKLSKAKQFLKRNYIGIVGMGGIGKTTLAKAILDDATTNSLYQASCFIEAKKGQSPEDILRRILPKLGNNKKPANLRDAQEMMKEILSEKKVLLVLDDIKEEALVHHIVPPSIIQASKGTTVLMTTREWNTIKSLVGNEGRLDVELLDEKEAMTLFTSHLSLDVVPLSSDLLVLCKRVVEACNGLPLSLKVMGAFLRHKKRLRNWERALQRMAKGRSLDGDEEIWNTLQISYDGLNDEVEKMMFLDVACFFCRDVYPFGLSQGTMLYMWSKDGILPKDKLQTLIDRSLLKLNEDDRTIEMHDQLRDMGRKLAKDTRIWKASMIPESGFASKDVEVLEGISLQGDMNHHESLLKYSESFDFEKLRVLVFGSSFDNSQPHVHNLGLLLEIASHCPQLEAIMIGNSQNLMKLPLIPQMDMEVTQLALIQRIFDLCRTCASLKILDLIGLGFLEQLPNKFPSSNTLMRLDLSLCNALLTLPKEIGTLRFLRTLNLKACSSLVALPKEIGSLTSLEILNVEACSSLIALPKEVGKLTSLVGFFASECPRLVTLPNEIRNLTSLRCLHFGECPSFVTLLEEVGNLTSLEWLNLDGCSSLSRLPKEIGNLTFLKCLKLKRCSSMVALPMEVGNLTSLTWFSLKGCSSLVALPKEVRTLTSLTWFNLKGCSSLAALPVEVKNLTSLTTLDLSGCSSLVALPMEVGNLTSLTWFFLKGCLSLVALPMVVGNLTLLGNLDLEGCSSLVALPMELGNCTSLKWLNLKGCSSLVALPMEVGNLTSLTTLDLEGCSSLVALPMELGNLTSLTWFCLEGCSSLVALPMEVGNLTSLRALYLNGCVSLASLPKEIWNLTFLTALDLEAFSNLVALPKDIGNLTSLTWLRLKGCSSLVTLPMEVGNLTSLTTLVLEACSSLVTLPKEVGNLTSLVFFDLGACSNLVALPKEIGNLTSMTTLNLKECSNLVALPMEVGNLISLTTLDLKGCSNLVALPKEVGNLTLLTTLDLEACSSLVAFPEELNNLTSLKVLNLDASSSLVVPKEIEELTSLETLNISRHFS